MAANTDHEETKQTSTSNTHKRKNSNSTPADNTEGENINTEEEPKLCVVDNKFFVKVLKDFLLRFVRGFSGGVAAYSGLITVVALIRNPFRKRLPSIWKGIFSKDCMRTSILCALYPSCYHLFVEILGRLQKRRNGWTYGLAGGLAGLSFAALSTSKRQTLALFTLSRALGVGLSVLVKRGHVPALPLFEVGLFCACNSLLTYFATLNTMYLNEGYYRSTLKWSRDYNDEIFRVLFRIPGPRFVTCQEVGLHKDPCVQHQLIDFFYSLPAFAKIYLPIHIIPIIVFKKKIVKERPLYVLKSLAKNTVMSTLFLATMMFLLKVTLCALRNISHRPPPAPAYVPLLAGAASGLGVLFERFSRRKELSLFVLYQTLTGLSNAFKSTWIWPYLRVPYGLTFMFALSMMVVMHAYEREPDSLSLLVNGFLKFFVGAKNSGSVIVSDKKNYNDHS